MGGDIEVVPPSISAEEVQNMKPDGIFLSNGPGDPQVLVNPIKEVKKMMQTDMLRSFIKADTEIIENKHSGKYISNLNFDVNQITILLADALLSLFKDISLSINLNFSATSD